MTSLQVIFNSDPLQSKILATPMVQKNKSQTTKLEEITGLTENLLENIVLEIFHFLFFWRTPFAKGKISSKTENLFSFSFGDHLFLRRFCPSKMAISKKKKKILHLVRLEWGQRELNESVDEKISVLVGLVFGSRLWVLRIKKGDIWLVFECPRRKTHFKRKKEGKSF